MPRGADGATAFLRGFAEALDRALDFGERAAAADARAPGATPAAGAGGGARRADGFMHDAYMRQANAPNGPRGGPGDPAARPFAPRDGAGPAGFSLKKNPKKQVVRECALVRARSMYGFHAHERLFVKISLLDPACMSRVRAALLSGGVADRTFQPFEAHVPFPLQAMMDLNLTGAGVVRCAEACFREPTPRWPRAHTRRVASRRRLRLGGAAMEEEEGSASYSRRRRGPLELEFEDAEPAGAYGARAEDAEAFGLFGSFGAPANATANATKEPTSEKKASRSLATPPRGGIDTRDSLRTNRRAMSPDVSPGTNGSDGPLARARAPPRVWTRETVPRRWTRVALRRHGEILNAQRNLSPAASREGDDADSDGMSLNLSESDREDRNTAPPRRARPTWSSRWTCSPRRS